MTFIVVFIIMIIISFLVLGSTIKIQNTTFSCVLLFSRHCQCILGSGTTLFRKFFLGAYVPMYTMEGTYVLSMKRMM